MTDQQLLGKFTGIAETQAAGAIPHQRQPCLMVEGANDVEGADDIMVSAVSHFVHSAA